MPDNEGPSPKLLRQQIDAYTRELARYRAYAEALKRVLGLACRESIPNVIVQTRAKTMSSFVEKCIRKFKKYPDPVKNFTDLCGGRLIVQTLEQVKAVKLFIERNFDAFEYDDKSSLLGEDKFGYRDMHYLVRLLPGRAQTLGFTKKEIKLIGDRVAEVQVRSIVQHAWADILHDRVYKTPLKLSTETKRTGALLAAIMEDGDRSFDQLAGELDGMTANYSAYASRENVEKEIKVNRFLYEHSSVAERPKVALKLARLIAADGKWAEIVPLLKPHEHVQGPLRTAVLLELGQALCRLHRAEPKSAAYGKGQAMLEQAGAACDQCNLDTVPNPRRNRSIHARALARLGWALEPFDAEAHRARECYRQAVELEPANPYYLANMLGFELKFAAGTDLVAGFRASIHSALEVCRQHGAAGTELPAAFFTAARLNMLLGAFLPALEDYACGICHWLSKDGCVNCNFLEDEIAWLHRVHSGAALPAEFQWAEDLLRLAQSLETSSPARLAASALARNIDPPVLIVAGGAASQPEYWPKVETLLQDALAVFHGTVISGGTTSGVPGCVGAVAGRLTKTGQKGFRLLGYIPKALPLDAQKDKRYELIVSGAEQFSPAQIFQGWKDLLAAGIKPKDVMLLGYGGDPDAALEYRLALALGASVSVVLGSGGSAAALLKDPLWCRLPKLYPVPPDPKTLRALVLPDGCQLDETMLDEMAKEFHARYRAGNRRKIKPDNLKDWPDLPATYQTANREQAAYAIRILEAVGFGLRTVAKPAVFKGFTDGEIERMAELEHGRWNIERLRDGWRPGPRDDIAKTHNCLAPWAGLPDGPEGVKRYDRDSVRSFPEILAKAGLEVYRKPRKSFPLPPKRKK